MGCGSSLPKRPDTRGVSDELKKILVGGTGDGGSPPSSIDLATRKGAATINGQLLGELIRAVIRGHPRSYSEQRPASVRPMQCAH